MACCISREWVVWQSYGMREASERSWLNRFAAVDSGFRSTASTGNSSRRRATFSFPGEA